MSKAVQDLIQKTQKLSNLYIAQRYRQLTDVLGGQQDFIATKEFKDIKNFIENQQFDFGISKYENNQNLKILKYGQVQEEKRQQYSIGLFIIPAGMTMPLHDHPGMYVFQKYLFGQAELTTISLERKANIIKQFTFPLHLMNDNKCQDCIIEKKIIQKDDSAIVYPINNNVHGFKAITNFAFLDILVPHYDHTSRHCNFYNILNTNEEQNRCEVELKGMPSDYRTERIVLENV